MLIGNLGLDLWELVTMILLVASTVPGGPRVNKDDSSGYYTPLQAAGLLGLSRRRVTQLLNDGTLQGEQGENGRWKIPVGVVGAFLKQRARTTTTTTRSETSTAELVGDVVDRVLVLERRMDRLEDALNRTLNRFERVVEAHLMNHPSKIEKELEHGCDYFD